MERFNKLLILVVMMTGIFLLTGCNKINVGSYNTSKEETVTVIPGNNQNQSDDASGADSANSKETPTPSTIQPEKNKELTVYNVNTDGEIGPVTALVPQGNQITPKLIVDTVVDALADQSITIGVDQVSTDKDAVIVSFMKDKAPYSNMGSGFEEAILDAISQSLFDNLKNYNKVIFRVEGKNYKGGAFELGINEPYMEK